MRRALLVTTLLLVGPGVAFSQSLRVLHITIALIDADRHTTPVPHHALLISDSPPTTAPRRIITAMDGTADVRLRPGTYIIESDRPVAFERKAYQWTQTVIITSDRDATLELTAANADMEPISSATSSADPLETDPSMLVLPWQDSVVALWTPTTHASGFLVDARGLIATDRRAVGASTSVEVQLTSSVKVAGRVLVADPARDVAIIWIDPAVVQSVRPIPAACDRQEPASLADGQRILTLATPLRERTGLVPGVVTRVEPRNTMSDFMLAEGAAGSPVFSVGGALVGLTSGVDDDNGRREQFRVVGIDAMCNVLTSAKAQMTDAAPPSNAHLPVEPLRPFPIDALKDDAKRRGGSLGAYMTPASDFDVALMTPVMIYAAQQKPDETSGRMGSGGAGARDRPQPSLRALSDFSNWASYIADVQPVLLIRATPKLVEGFWTTVARGAALTQGVALPAMKHFKPGFSRMRAFCGEAEVNPIHPFRIEQRVSESEAMYEGLYVFDPKALGPQCGAVKLVLYSEKEPEKGETRVVDPKIIQQIWQDFEPYRALE